MNQSILLSQIEEVGADIGEPDCKLVNPFIVKPGRLEGTAPTLEPWLSDCTSQTIFMIHSDKIITLADPRPTLLEKYQTLTK